MKKILFQKVMMKPGCFAARQYELSVWAALRNIAAKEPNSEIAVNRVNKLLAARKIFSAGTMNSKRDRMLLYTDTVARAKPRAVHNVNNLSVKLLVENTKIQLNI